MAEFEHLFTPIKLGPCTLKNRICCSAHADALANDGMPDDRARRYYEEKAIGGVGFMMCLGSASVHPTSTARDWNGVEVFDDRVIPFSAKVQRRDAPARRSRLLPDHPSRPAGTQYRSVEPDVRPQ